MFLQISGTGTRSSNLDLIFIHISGHTTVSHLSSQYLTYVLSISPKFLVSHLSSQYIT
jgi:hypothetical protein